MFFRWFCKPRLKPLSKQHGSAAMKVINTSRPHCTGSGSWFSSLYHRITVSERLRTLKNNQDKSQQSTVTVIPCVQRNKAMGYGPWGYEFEALSFATLCHVKQDKCYKSCHAFTLRAQRWLVDISGSAVASKVIGTFRSGRCSLSPWSIVQEIKNNNL